MATAMIRAYKPEYSKLSDTDLMIELGSGEQRSLEELVKRHERPLVGYLSRIINDTEKARDLAQETFIRIFKHARGYRTTTRFTTWLYHIARNIARDELRSRKRRPLTMNDEAVQIEAAECSSQRHTEVREMVMTVLKKLSSRDRRLLVLRDLEGLSYEEIATATGMALGTVKSGISRARNRFREHYQAINSQLS